MRSLRILALAIVLLLGFGVAFQANAQDQTAVEKKDKKEKKKKRDKAEKTVTYLSLADLLRRQPGVMVQGSGNNATVSVRGGAGVSGTEPLYVIDKVPIGTSYGQVAGMVDVNDIANINVLSGADASQYGTRGNGGVIEITTKKN